MQTIEERLARQKEQYCQDMMQAADELPQTVRPAAQRYATKMTRLHNDLPPNNPASAVARWQRDWFSSVDEAGREFFSDPAWLTVIDETQRDIQLTLLGAKHQKVRRALVQFESEIGSCDTVEERRFKTAAGRYNRAITEANLSYVVNRSKTDVPENVAAYFVAMRRAYEKFVLY